MKKGKAVIWAAFLLIVSISAQEIQTDNPDNKGQDELEKILEKCAEYCEKLTHSVLDFVCREKITEEIYTPGSRSTEVIRESRPV